MDAAMAEGSPTDAVDITDKENTEPASNVDNLDMDGRYSACCNHFEFHCVVKIIIRTLLNFADLESFGKKKKKKKKAFNLEELDSALPSETTATEPNEDAQDEPVEVSNPLLIPYTLLCMSNRNLIYDFFLFFYTG